MICGISLNGQLLEPGNVVLSCLPGDDDVTLVIKDISQLGMLWMNPANHNVDQSSNVPAGKQFTAADFEGNWIYSTAIDERDGTVYAATEGVYSGTASTPSAIGQSPVEPIIYKVDPSTCVISRVATLPEELGIGYISLDTTRNMIFATNMDDGMIYGVDMFTGAIIDTWDFGAPDSNGTGEYPDIGDRLLGVDYNYGDGKLYYSVWTDNRFDASTVNNNVRSIQLDAAGNFLPATDQLEITLPLPNGVDYTQPVGDIEFNDAGDKVLLAETPFVTNISSADTTIAPSSHDARLTCWMNVGGTWMQCPAAPGNNQGTFDVGDQTTYDGLNSRGGADWAYKSVDGCSFEGDEDFVVTTGDFLKDITLYGFQFTEATGGNNTNSILVDGDYTQGQSKYVYADIDVYKPKPVYDVELNKTVSTTTAALGDIVTYTIEVFNNSCDTVHNVTVLDTLPTGAVYSAHTPAGSNYNPTTGLWTLGDIPQGETITLSIDVTLTSTGSFYNLAEINGMDELDEDSTPNNGNSFEDDIDAACVSVPILLPCDDSGVTITAASGYATYTWYKDGVAITGESGQSIIAQESGSYTYEVSENGCTIGTCCAIEVEEQTCCDTFAIFENDDEICNGADANIGVDSIQNATAPYTYIWSTGDNTADISITGLTSDSTFYVTITDANDCMGMDTVTVVVYADLSCTSAETSAPTCGASNGEATVTIVGGTAPYTYLWDDVSAQTTEVASGLTAGVYSVVVTDANDCTTSCSVTLTDIGGPSCTAAETSAPTCGASNGEAAVMVSEGTAPYTYLWDDASGQTTASATGLAAGTYTVEVTDANNCTTSCSVTLTDIGGPSCLAAETSAPTCGASNGEAAVTVSEGTAPYTYLWDDASGQTTASATGLAAGTYTVAVTDANNCTTSCSVTLTDVGGPTCTAEEITAPTCGASNGEASVTVSEGTAPYTYLWDDASGQTTASATGLPAGTYTVEVTDANNCTTNCSVTLTDVGGPTCTAGEITAPTCGASNGEAAVTVSEGTAPYTYLWDDASGQTTASATGLAAGTYAVEVTDANNCTTSCSVTLTDVGGPTCTAEEITAPTCGASNGEASVTVSEGTAPYTYLWDDASGQTTASAIGLQAGTYTVEVTDANNCTTSCSVTLTDVGGPTCTAEEITAPTCGASNGEAAVTVSEGTAPYTYLWDDASGQTTASATGLPAGTYTVAVTDANNCTTSCSVTLTDVGGPTCTAGEITAPTCGASNGEAAVTVSEGTAPYTYLWDDASGQTTASATGLAAGTYTVAVTDANNCTTSCSVTLTDVGGPTCTAGEITAPTCGASNGEVLVTVSEGTAPYTYLWDDASGQTTASATGLAAGTYTVAVTDANNCTTSCSVTLTDVGGPICTAGEITAPTCGASNGEAAVTVSEGTAPYTYLWDDASGQTTASATGLAAGTYTVAVTDANNCTTSCSVTLTDVGGPTCTAGEITAPTCGASNGETSVTVSEGTAPYTYLWDDASGQTTASATGLAAGTYTVAVTDANNCTTSCSVTLTDVGGPTCTAEEITAPTCGASNGEAAVTVSEGTAPYTYLWDDASGQTTASATGLPAGTYTVAVTDANNCTTSCSVTLSDIVGPSCEIINSTNPDCQSSNGEATVTVTEGTAPFTYLWNDVSGQTTATATGLPQGTYIVIVTDANNCSTSCEVSLSEVNCSYDLALRKTINNVATPGPYNQGSTVTYIIDVFNQGSLDASNIEVTDYVPAGMSFISSPDFSGTAPHTALIANLAAGSNTSLEITLQIDSDFMGTSITNNAEITADDGEDADSTPGSEDGSVSDPNDDDIDDTTGGDDYDPATIQINQVYDLALRKTVDNVATPGPFGPGSNVTYIIEVFNQGTLDANNVEVTDYIPSGMSFVSSPDFSATAPHTATIASLSAGGNSSLEITLQIDNNFMGDALINNAEITADDGDDSDSVPASEDGSAPDDNDDDIDDTTGGDDYDPASISVNQVYDLALRKTIDNAATPGPFSQGSNVTYSIEVFNQGTLDAANIEITDFIPAGMSFVSSPDFSATVPHTATIASLSAGTSTSIEITLQIDSDFMGTSLTNNAEITADDGDDADSTPGSGAGSNPDIIDDDIDDTTGGDDYDRADISVEQVYDLALRKTVDSSTPGPYEQGSSIAYVIEVFNQGTLDATNIEVTDYIPTGMSFVSSPDFSTTAPHTATIASLSAGTSTSLEITLQIDTGYMGTSISNNAEITADDGDDVDSTPASEDGSTSDPNDDDIDDSTGGDDYDPSTIEVVQVYDLALIKELNTTVSPGPFVPGDEVVFTINVFNQGTLDASNVEITDYIPSGMSLSLSDSNGWVVQASGDASVIVPSVLAGNSASIDIVLTIDATFSGLEITNWAEISADDGDDQDSEADSSNFSTDGEVDNLDNDNVIDNTNGDEDDHDPANIEVLQGFIGDFVWKDLNGNGQQDPNEPGVPNVIIILNDCNGVEIDRVTTDSDGAYSFEGLLPGDYQLKVDLSTIDNDCIIVDPYVGGDNNTDSDFGSHGFAACITLAPGDRDSTIDLGLLPLASLGDFVWHDLNGNGIQDGGEPFLEGVGVDLYDENGIIIKSTVTDSNGQYIFEGLNPGRYYVQFSPPEGFTITSPNSGNDNNSDSNLDGSNGINTSSFTTLSPGEHDPSWDAGFYMCVPFGDLVFYDLNENDQFDSDENGLNGLIVTLYRKYGDQWVEFDDEITGNNPNGASDDGYFKFCVPPGSYYVSINVPPIDLVPVRPGQGSEENDSDLTGDFGMHTTGEIIVQSGDTRCDIGLGYYPMSSFGDIVWRDDNADGVRQNHESGFEGVKVEAYDVQNNMINSATTNGAGIYRLDNLQKDQYYLKFNPPAGYSFSTSNSTTNDGLDSDVDHSNGANTTGVYTTAPGVHMPNVDAGLVVGVALPVDLVSFVGQYRSDFVYLSWATATEINTEYFAVERRHESEDEFMGITRQPAFGSAYKYQLNDYNILNSGTYYYRLRIIDTDGSEELSDVISVDIDRDRNGINLYPNPSIDKVNIEFTLGDSKNVRIDIFNVDGRMIGEAVINKTINKGKTLTELDLRSIPAGVYSVKIQLDNNVITKPLIVLEN